MKSTILFYDGVCPKPYTLETLEIGSQGGTEATVLRVTLGLIRRGHNCILEQRNRENVEIDPISERLEYSKPNSRLLPEPDVVITLRDAGHYLANKQRFPKAKHYLWLHDVVSGDYQSHLLHHLQNQDAELVVVSEWHKQQVIQQLMPIISSGRIFINRIYNPLADYCVRKSGTQVDPHKLIFMSSPHKGLDYALAVFEELYKQDNAFRLHVANPGYYKDFDGVTPNGVVLMGPTPHKQLMEEVRTSLCTFYPQISFEETFGLVYAESNAVGTPVLCHPIGASQEVLEHRGQFVDCRDVNQVIKTITEWQSGGRLILKGNPQFEIGNVIKEWEKLL
jgi:glycosyltransferase involved in cell wall biosynthesis